ncbi:TPA: hypothetical protein HA278_03760, partial [Candidatus Woesearchaeota archaeon]|nr:hypothetical protein [Candidatus Woesearchaeota archaeon]
DTYRDFNEAGFGALMLDTVSYVGDIMSFYLDYQANESFLHTSIEYDNILKLGRQSGHRFLGNPSSWGIGTFFIVVPAVATGLGPDMRYVPTLKTGSQFRSKSGSNFMLAEDVRFALSEHEVRVANVDETTGVPLSYAIKAYGTIVSGSYGEEIVSIGEFEPFKRITLSASNVTEIVSVIDLEGHEYFGVDFLSQNVVYRAIANRSDDTALSILKPFVVPRRFIVDRDKTRMHLQFGAGQEADLSQDNQIADPSSVILQMHGKNYITDEAFDPAKLIASDNFGVAPSNTDLRIIYRANSSSDVNASAGSVNQVVAPKLEFSDPTVLSLAQMLSVRSSIEIDNEEPIVGDVALPKTPELKRRIYGTFAAQNRAVTTQDYESMVYQMPPKYGAIKRVSVVRDPDSLKRNLNMYVISEDDSANLVQTNDVIKRNLKTWLIKNKMIQDTIDILDARVVNFGIDYTIVGALDGSNNDKFSILSRCQRALERHFERKLEIGEAFWITDIYKALNAVDGVVDTTFVKIIAKTGGAYSDTRFNIAENMSADGRYVNVPKNVIFEVLLPDSTDIKGVVK